MCRTDVHDIYIRATNTPKNIWPGRNVVSAVAVWYTAHSMVI